MRVALATALIILAGVPVSAQDFQRPADWEIRFDQPTASEDQLEMFVAMPPGWHVTSGPAGIYWAPDHQATGSYRIEMDVYLFDPGQRREAFGIFLGGQDLQGPGQRYTYFLIRNGGQFIVKHRSGDEAPTVEPWTGHEAIRSFADRGDDASVLNRLAVEVAEERFRFFVNDVEVWSGPQASLPVDGIFGFRVNHGLNLHVSRIEATALR